VNFSTLLAGEQPSVFHSLSFCLDKVCVYVLIFVCRFATANLCRCTESRKVTYGLVTYRLALHTGVVTRLIGAPASSPTGLFILALVSFFCVYIYTELSSLAYLKFLFCGEFVYFF